MSLLMPRRKKIFLSYRRGDTAGHVGRLYDDLVRVFGADRVFMDIGGLAPGDDFIQVLRQRLAESVIVLVVIGSRWAGVSDDGHRRIDDENDFVRLEVMTALADERTRVIPVLCDGARMPADNNLPAPLLALTRRQAFEISDVRWRQDVQTLFDAIAPFVPFRDRGKRFAQRALLALAALLVLGIGGLYAYRAIAPKLSALLSPPKTDSDTERDIQRDAKRSAKNDAKHADASPDAKMPTAPELHILPPNVVATAAEQLARARHEWADDAELSFIDIECSDSRRRDCKLRLLMSSASRVATLDAQRVAPDSAWKYRTGGGGNRPSSLSLEIAPLERVVAAARAAGVTSDLEHVRYERTNLQNNSSAPRWIVWPHNRDQAGRDGRLCFEPQSAAQVDCRTGQ